MGKMRSPWKPNATMLVVIFLLLLVATLFFEKVEAATKVEVSYGLTAVGGEKYESEALIFTEKFDNDKYQIGIMLQLRLDCAGGSSCKRGESKSSNQAITIQRVVKNGNFQMGFGISYWHNQSPAWNSHTPYFLSVNYAVLDKWSINYKHFSTGGSSTNNGGLDFITVGYSF